MIIIAANPSVFIILNGSFSLVFVILFIVGTKRFKDKILSVKYLYLNIPKFNPKNKKIRMKMPSKIPWNIFPFLLLDVVTGSVAI